MSRTHKRVTPSGHGRGGKSPVVNSAAAGDSVLRRAQEMAQGLRQPGPSHYLDLTYTDPDYYIEALNSVADTKRRFAALPSGLRAACLNDPRQLLVLQRDAVSGDPVSRALLARYGVEIRDVTPTPAPTPVPPLDGPGDGSIPLGGA